MDEERIRSSVASILEAVGEDPLREGLKNTPRRVARMYGELFAGMGVDPASSLDTIFDEEGHEGDIVVLRNVPFFSMCEHHLLPFFGEAHMGYVQDGRVVGASKLARALEVVARRPQLQERMTGQLADAIHEVLNPNGTAVVIEAEHLCMSMRGVKKDRSRIVTTATRGRFDRGGVTRAELLDSLNRRGS